MSTQELDSMGLHLPDLVVKGFRGIEDLTVSRLGRVNLISGKNGVGKTSLLDAVRVYAARGDYPVLFDILRTREELVRHSAEDGDEFFVPDLESLFYGRHTMPDICISIGSRDVAARLGLKIAPLSEEYLIRQNIPLQERVLSEGLNMLKVEFQDSSLEIPINSLLRMNHLSHRGESRYVRSNKAVLPPGVLCEILGPDLLRNADIARFWDRVALTNDEALAIDILSLIFDGAVERVAIVGDGTTSPGGRKAVAKLKSKDRPVPLRSLGDGAVRLFGVALAIANSKDGFLLIDEVENGIHYSLQRDFWKMIMKAAHENNVQVFATTHSWDCVRGFAWAAEEMEEVEGALIRLQRQRKNGRLRAVEYSENDLKFASEHGIEVR